MGETLWNDMFVLTLPVLEKVSRPILVYGFLVIGLRLAGKRELAQLNPFDLVVLLTLSNTVQNAIIGDDTTVIGGIIGAATLLIVNYVVVRLLYGHDRLGRLVEGEAELLIEHGKLNEQVLKKNFITVPELEMAAHKQGIDSLAEVERAVLESGGTISFVAKKPIPEDLRHSELMGRLDQIMGELAALRAAQTARS